MLFKIARLHPAKGYRREFVEIVRISLDFDYGFDLVAVIRNNLFDQVVAAVGGRGEQAYGPYDLDRHFIGGGYVGDGVECGALGPVLQFFVYCFVTHFECFS